MICVINTSEIIVFILLNQKLIKLFDIFMTSQLEEKSVIITTKQSMIHPSILIEQISGSR